MPAEGTPPDASLRDRVTIDDVRAAAARLHGVAHRTPVVSSRSIDFITGTLARFKCENLQRVGAFKFRGAYNAIASLSDDARRAGVLAYSSGNHAQAVALAASLLGAPAVIVMPENAPRVKLAATRAYLERAPKGSEVVLYDPATTVREELGARLAAERGMTVVPPYDHPAVIAGQGTAGLELCEDAGPIDVLLVPCGGGGLLSGCAVATRAVCRACRIIGVEPELADDATRSFRDGVLRTVRNPPTIADGARTPSLGRHTFALVTRHVDDMMTASEGEIARAALLAMERLKLVVEPTGALALAGLLRLAREQPDEVAGRTVGVIISGGNLDLSTVPELIRLAES
ncbi:MAG: threo-3-hydroxy-L-aspartate ammonia-lyase [Leptolyngbya sp. PLA2]|nr:threo-3-hydroxy-L-aspartate ammonia-lyase [Leptolyngbya sp.]MCE7971195.1 threo-3-hydroxy-L-aspartate ammonia-lyase [Leptolyngbya sp. PL-A2]MCQ3940874.1 threo-3-hydroxy-L-aspartate ammonia-lyase [cyanobacterium CYA1]MCZ7634103.1 threo-3-hydroxy-L-aspartate ammonia-lyase [Phycisphaerales bacterium]MDL1905188.1 threo-3-hydroxy-L-aspartate ammonia-lyase [Synechococcales cyanobacterium CNB]GIK19262.1 MAG: serine/threonine dehydratase [Planctomycetota bacterium]